MQTQLSFLDILDRTLILIQLIDIQLQKNQIEIFYINIIIQCGILQSDMSSSKFILAQKHKNIDQVDMLKGKKME